MATVLFASCNQIQVNNWEFCTDFGRYGATCNNTLNNNSRDIPKVRWDAERVGQFCTRAETIADIKAVVEKLCTKARNCVYETQLTKFFNEADHATQQAVYYRRRQ